jgi:hypothetical protein
MSKTEGMEQIMLTPEDQLSSSNLKLPVGPSDGVVVNRVQNKFFISIDALRLVGYHLSTKDPRYSEDTYDILPKSWYIAGKNDLSLYAKEVLGQIQVDSVIELKYGSYKADLLQGKSKGEVRA